MLKKFLVVLVIFTGSTTTLSAQESSTPDTLVAVSLQDGTTHSGRIITQNENTITLLTNEGIEIKLSKKSVVSIVPLKGDAEPTQYYRSEPNYSRLLFGPTGKTLKAGQGYISLIEIFFATISYGITDNFTINGGMSLFLWTGMENQWFFLGGKMKIFTKDSLDVSGGIAYSKVAAHDDPALIFYGVSTIGTKSASLTLGLGYGLSGGDSFANPIFIFGGEYRIGRSMKLISENWIFGGMDPYRLSLALQFLTKNLAVDVGIVYPATEDEDDFPILPWLGFTYNF